MNNTEGLDLVIEQSLRKFGGRVCIMCGKRKIDIGSVDYCRQCSYLRSEGFVSNREEDSGKPE